MDERDAVVEGLHQVATEMVVAVGRTVEGEPGDDLLASYGLSSVDVLEFLLLVEERYDVTFEDDELTEQTVSSAEALATQILSQRSKA